MKYIFILALSIGLVGCNIPIGSIPYPVSKIEHDALEDMFGNDVTVYVEKHTYITSDAPIDSHETGNYYTFDKNIVLYQSSIDTARHELTIVHEATHYYQDVYLHRKMVSDGIYSVPIDLTKMTGIEEEAEITRLYEVEKTAGLIIPIPYIMYLQQFMSLPRN